MIRFYEDDFSLDEITTDKYITAIRMRDIDTFTAAVAAPPINPLAVLISLLISVLVAGILR